LIVEAIGGKHMIHPSMSEKEAISHRICDRVVDETLNGAFFE
jgi:hypothetical protein